MPTKLNPLGAKGAGEAGTVGAMPAVMNAVHGRAGAARRHDVDMPATGAERLARDPAAKKYHAGPRLPGPLIHEAGWRPRCTRQGV